MRIVIDMQGAQTESRFRGIGRYSLSLALAIARQRGEHEIILALNGLFPDTIQPVREAFYGVLPQSHILVWDGVGPTRETNPDNRLRREASERLREAFLQAQHPDVILLTSLFEGFGDDAVTSIGQFDLQTPTAVILYDLIPLLSPDEHFLASQLQQDYYGRKIASLKQSKLLLAISESARQEALAALQYDPQAVVNISGAFDATFTRVSVSPEQRSALLAKYGIERPFVFYTGGADARKNLHRLIEAYAGLPKAIRASQQLVLAGRMPEVYVKAFLQTAAQFALAKDELLFLGYVSDDDLLQFYNCCEAFVFPSLHEGFGIPPLEAMSCGAPVIGAHATSLPEVIGLSEALFEPTSVEAIRDKLCQVLTDQAFRERLITHGLQHSKTFTWDSSALDALAAIESRFAKSQPKQGDVNISVERTSLFQPDTKKIVLLKLDHLGDFILAIPAIMRLKARYPFATIDLIVGSWSVPLAQSLKLFNNIYPFDYFKKKSSEAASATKQAIRQLVAQLEPYDFAIDLRRQPDTRLILTHLPAALKVGYQTFDVTIDGKLDFALPAHPDSVFEATALNQTPISVQMTRLIDALPHGANDYVALPELQVKRVLTDTQIAVFPKAGNDVKEWSQENFTALIALLSARPDVDAVNVYFANSAEAQAYGLPTTDKVHIHAGLSFNELTESLTANVLCIANNSFGAHIGGYLGLVVVAIYGGHETVTEWAPVFNSAYVIHHPVPCSPCHIAHRSECPYALKCLTEISVEVVYQKVAEALRVIEQQLTVVQAPDTKTTALLSQVRLDERRSMQSLRPGLLQALADLDLKELSFTDKLAMSQAIASNHSSERPRYLFVDISELVQRDAKSGIQRVVRSVLREMLDHAPIGFTVIPVYARPEQQGYFKATQFTQQFLGLEPSAAQQDEPILYGPGDYFLGLDLHPHLVYAQREVFGQMRARGVTVQFVVFDLLCSTMPQHFVSGSKEPFEQWLQVVAQSDGAICISQAVAQELEVWFAQRGVEHPKGFKIQHFSLGSDLKGSVPSMGRAETEQQLLDRLKGQNNFLMVGTLEPRKGHAHALAAFELLWQAQQAVNLVIVGKQGWLVDDLVQKLQQHPLAGKQLFWVQGASDELLEQLYGVSRCLVVPSEGEGFGLPLIEAAYYNLPIIARDLPVFKEIAQDHAYYFAGFEPRALAQAVQDWLVLYQRGEQPASGSIQRLTWKQSTQQLLKTVFNRS